MRLTWIFCLVLMCCAIFGDLIEAKKVKSDKNTKEIKTHAKVDKAVKHHKAKYLQETQKPFEIKKDKREAKKTETLNGVEENGKSVKPKRKCNNPEGCSKAAGKQEVPNKKLKKSESAAEELKMIPSEKVQKDKFVKTKVEKINKHQKKQKKIKEIPVENEKIVQSETKNKKNKISKIEKTEKTETKVDTPEHSKKSKRSIDVAELLDEPEVVEEVAASEEIENDEATSCDKTEVDHEDNIKSEEEKKQTVDKLEEESNIAETL